MMGQPIRGGTAFSQILLDDQMLPQLLADIDTERKVEVEEEQSGDLSRLDESTLQMADPCSSVQFQASLVMPPSKAMMEEEDIELNIME
jgi:hypothetical protein